MVVVFGMVFGGVWCFLEWLLTYLFVYHFGEKANERLSKAPSSFSESKKSKSLFVFGRVWPPLGEVFGRFFAGLHRGFLFFFNGFCLWFLMAHLSKGQFCPESRWWVWVGFVCGRSSKANSRPQAKNLQRLRNAP